MLAAHGGAHKHAGAEVPRRAPLRGVGTVNRAQRDLVKVVRRLRPVLAWKGA
jgi:hypothetical protein